jgi:hypothetical protein
MRFWIGGPRLFGLRTGISFGPEDFARMHQRTTQRAPSGKMEGAFVYVVKGEHAMTKIGFSTNPDARLAQLRTGSAFPIDFAYVAAVEGDAGGAFAVEQAAHALLSRNRVNGEWFDVPPEMAVAAISAASVRVGRKIIQVDADKVATVIRLANEPEKAKPSNLSYLIAFLLMLFIGMSGLSYITVPALSAIAPLFIGVGGVLLLLLGLINL